MAESLGLGEKFKQENYASNLVNLLNTARRRNHMCDVVLQCREREYYAHRNVLGAASPYFYSYFSDNLKSQASQGIQVDLTNSISPAIMEDLLQFMYLGEVCVHKENVRLLIAASDFLQMSNLKDIVCRFYEKKLCASNCLSISSLADEFNCKTLKDSADQFIYQHFIKVSQSDEFKGLNVTQVCHIIQNPSLNITEEERVFESVMSWVGHDREERCKYIPILLKHVRLCFINKYYIFDCIINNDLIMEFEECRKIVIEAINYQTLKDRRQLTTSLQCTARDFFDLTKIIIAYGGSQDELSTKETLCYVPTVDFWYPLSPLLCERNNFGAAICDEYLYAIGGDADGRPLKSAEYFDFGLNKWTAVSNLPEPSMGHGTAVLNGEVYVIGGGNKELCFARCLKYNKSTNQWTTIQSLRVPRRGACVVATQQLYAIGGYGPNGIALASVERYDPYADEWAKIFPMNSSRANASGAVCGDKIFVIGGEYAMWSFYCSGEVFDTKTDEWRAIADCSIPRSFTGIAVVDKYIYVFGGMQSLYTGTCDDEDFVDASECTVVEIYDIDKDSWEMGCPLPIPTSGLKCVTLEVSKQAVESRCGMQFPQDSN